jgi:hypothetical protein
MITLNLVDTCFEHIGGCSIPGKRPRFVTWDRKRTSAGPTIFTDWTVDKAARGVPDQYAWLMESPAGAPGPLNLVIDRLNRFAAVFTNRRELVRADPAHFHYAPVGGIWISRPGLRPKTKKLSMIVSDKSKTTMQVERLAWASRLEGAADIFGRATRPIATKEEGLDPYMFSVAIENVRSEGYWTEKLLDCFATGTIPVYKGAPDIGRWFDDRGIIQLEDGFEADLSLTRYASLRPYIIANLHEALRYEIPDDRLVVDHFLPYLTPRDPAG